jgi:geranylgeranyl diphosphate synthase type II
VDTLAHDAALVDDRLAAYGERTRAALRDYLPEGSPGDYLYDLVADYPSRGGKMMRPSLCLATARALGAGEDEAIASAVAIELLHNAILIHDDIEDASEQRRGRPTLHALHGVPLALNAGDLLSLLSWQPLKRNRAQLPAVVAAAIAEEMERTAWECAEGQALELGWRRANRFDLADADYLTMVCKKTCWLGMIHPCRVGALIATYSRARFRALFRFGFLFGAAFQITDDLLNLETSAGYGKERDGDLWEGKRTLMLCHLYRVAAPGARARIAAALSVPRHARRADDVAWIHGEMDAAGSLDYARTLACALGAAALREFDAVFDGVPASDDRAFIRALVRWSIERVH